MPETAQTPRNHTLSPLPKAPPPETGVRAKPPKRFSDLPAAQQRLARLMQEINHGRIINLKIADGKPIFNPTINVVRVLKFPGDNGPRNEIHHADFELTDKLIEFFAFMEEIGSGTISVVEIRQGLPCGSEVAEMY